MIITYAIEYIRVFPWMFKTEFHRDTSEELGLWSKYVTRYLLNKICDIHIDVKKNNNTYSFDFKECTSSQSYTIVSEEAYPKLHIPPTGTRFIYIFVYYLRLSIKKGPYRFRVGRKKFPLTFSIFFSNLYLLGNCWLVIDKDHYLKLCILLYTVGPLVCCVICIPPV